MQLSLMESKFEAFKAKQESEQQAKIEEEVTLKLLVILSRHAGIRMLHALPESLYT